MEWKGQPLAYALTAGTVAGNLNPVNTVKLTAHRGSSAAAPENTLAAFRQAITDGADYIELNVWTVNDPGIMLRLMEFGADNIITDKPAELKSVLEEWNGAR